MMTNMTKEFVIPRKEVIRLKELELEAKELRSQLSKLQPTSQNKRK